MEITIRIPTIQALRQSWRLTLLAAVLVAVTLALSAPEPVDAANGPFAYVPNSGDDTVSVIDTATNTVTTTISVGDFPRGVAASPTTPTAYVANFVANSVSVIDTLTNTVSNTIQVGTSPDGIVVNPTGTRVYTADRTANTVTVIDAGTFSTSSIAVNTDPAGIDINPAGTRVYVANNGSSNVSVIDTATSTIVATVMVGASPEGVAVNPAGTRVYVANFNSNTVSVIDTSTNAEIKTIGVGSRPFGIAINQAGSRMYVTNRDSNDVSVVNLGTNAVIVTEPVGTAPHGVAVNPADTRIYVANHGSNNVSVIDASTNSGITTVSVGSGPFSHGKFVGPNVKLTSINITNVGRYALPKSCFEVRDASQTALFTVCDNDFQGAPASHAACDDGTDTICDDEDPADGSVTVTVDPAVYNVVVSKVPLNHTADAAKGACSGGPVCTLTFNNTNLTTPWFPWDVSGLVEGPPGTFTCNGPPDGVVDLLCDILGVIQHHSQTKP